jgi:hypothetical protein
MLARPARHHQNGFHRSHGRLPLCEREALLEARSPGASGAKYVFLMPFQPIYLHVLGARTALEIRKPGLGHFTGRAEDFTLDVTGCRTPSDPLRITDSL